VTDEFGYYDVPIGGEPLEAILGDPDAPDDVAWHDDDGATEISVGAAEPAITRSSWAPVDLALIVAGVQAGEIVGPVPELMRRTDGVPLLYPGEIHSLAGEPETCKGWIVLAGVADLINAGRDVLYLDFEDAVASIVTRLLALGADPDLIPGHLAYVRPTEPFNAAAFHALLQRPYALAVIDGLSEAYSLLGFEINSNDDAPRFLAAIPRPLADKGAAVLEVDHVGRDRNSRGRYAIGAQHKLAGVAVAYGTEVIDAPSRITPGLVKLTMSKDRHGHVRGHVSGRLIAKVRIVPEDDGERVRVTFDPPDAPERDGGKDFRPTRLMERTSVAIEGMPGMSNAEIRDAVVGKAGPKATALRCLIREEYVEQRKNGKAVLHYSLRPFREDAE
jgi:hypothetical protein